MFCILNAKHLDTSRETYTQIHIGHRSYQNLGESPSSLILVGVSSPSHRVHASPPPGAVCDGAPPGPGEGPGQLHRRVRVPAHPPRAELWGARRHTEPTETHGGPPCRGGEREHDHWYTCANTTRQYVEVISVHALPLGCTVHKSFTTIHVQRATQWIGFVMLICIFCILEGNQGTTESKSGIQIKLFCVHTKWVIYNVQPKCEGQTYCKK